MPDIVIEAHGDLYHVNVIFQNMPIFDMPPRELRKRESSPRWRNDFTLKIGDKSLLNIMHEVQIF